MKKVAACLLISVSTFALTASTPYNPLLLHQYQDQPRSQASSYLQGVVDAVNGINNQQRLLGQHPIFCPPSGPYPVAPERARAILAKYARQADVDSTAVTAHLPAAELIVSQLRLDYPCTAESLERWRAQP